MNKKILARAAVLGLLLCGSASAGAWAEDLNVDNNSKWHQWNVGYEVDGGAEKNFENVTIDIQKTFKNENSCTALMVAGDSTPAVFKATGDVSIINHVDCGNTKTVWIFSIDYRVPGNNGIAAWYSNAAVDLTGAHSVYIDTLYTDTTDGKQRLGDAVSTKKGGTVEISTAQDGYTKLIGDIDFCERISVMGSNTDIANGIIKIDLNNANSFWYGDEQNTYEDFAGKTIERADFEEQYKDYSLLFKNKSGYLAYLAFDKFIFGESQGDLDLKLSNGGTWIYRLSPNISHVSLNEGGVIELRDDVVSERFGAVGFKAKTYDEGAGNWTEDGVYIKAHKYLTIYNLESDTAEGGQVNMDLKYEGKDALYDTADVGENSDYLFVRKGSGTYFAEFDASKAELDSMNATADAADKLYFANVKEGDVSFRSKTVEALPVRNWAQNIYDYKYFVGSEAASDASKGTDWFVSLANNGTNENIDIIDGASHAAFALATDLDRLNKRMGEARYFEGDRGMWVRYRHARTGWDESFKSSSNMYQLGYDVKKLEKDGTHYRGVAFDYTHADTSLYGLSGDGENDRYAFSLYDTWTGNKGHYRDIVVRYGRVNSEYDILTKSRETISTDYHQNFGSISGEWGRRKDTGNDWYFEPQTQIQFARLGGVDYTTNHGVSVSQKAASSVIGRLGFRLGHESGAEKKDNYYLKADVLHEFCGDRTFDATGADGTLHKSWNGHDTWFDIGVGADLTLGKNTYFWLDVERTLGSDYDRTWALSGGFRFEW